MSVIQEKAVQMISLLPDDKVEIIVNVMKGFMDPIGGADHPVPVQTRIGAARGKFTVPDDIDECNGKIAEMFGVGE